MARQRTDLETIFRAIEAAGSIEKYVDEQLRERGFLVDRKPTDGMSPAELKRYKQQLKTEAAERRKVKAEAWRAYKTRHIVHLGENVFWNDDYDFDRWDLENAEARAAENELPKLDKPKELAKALGMSVPELRWLAYHREAAETVHYYRFTIPKRDGTERPIWAPRPKLKAAQHWILRNVVERLLVHGAVHGFLPGRSTLTNAAAHTDAKVVLKMDLRNFFPTVTLPRVKGIFRKAGYREQIATLLALVCTESPREIVQHDGKQIYVALGPRCLPQGAPTSPGLTNVIGLSLDRRLTGLAAKFGYRYTRYADDLTFSLPTSWKKERSLGRLIGLVKRVVADEGFRVHADKTRVIRSGGRQQVTGLVVNGEGGPRTPRWYRREVRAALNNLANGKPLREGETRETLAGRIAYIAMTDAKLAADMSDRLNAIDG